MTELSTIQNSTAIAQSSAQSTKIPLVVDLDGSLLQSDLLYESFFSSIKVGIKHHTTTFRFLMQGKAPLKAYLAEASTLDYALLPFDPGVVALIEESKRQGRPVYLATASNQRHAEGVAAHFGFFDGIFSSDDRVNLAGKIKARNLGRHIRGAWIRLRRQQQH